MNIFKRKHKHTYAIPQLTDHWKQIHKEIIIDGNLTTKIDIVCDWGHVKQIEIDISLKLDHILDLKI